MSEAPATIGHNSVGIVDLIAENIHELHDKAATLRQRADDLNASSLRAEVTDEDSATKAATLVKMLNTLIDKTEKDRTAAKAPFLDAGKKVDGVFNPIKTVAETAKRETLRKIDAFRADQRRQQEAERQRLADEARRTQEAAQQATSATAAQELADKAATLATEAAKPVTTAPLRSDLGAVAATRKTLRHEVVDQNLLPPEYWVPDLGLVAAKVKSIGSPKDIEPGKRWQPIPGVEAWIEESTVVR